MTKAEPKRPEVEITNWHAIKREAIETLGRDEFDRRVAVAHVKARGVADDRTCLPEDDDRDAVFIFMAWRLQSLAVQLGPDMFAKYEAMAPDTLFCAVARMMERGVMI